MATLEFPGIIDPRHTPLMLSIGRMPARRCYYTPEELTLSAMQPTHKALVKSKAKRDRIKALKDQGAKL